MGLDVVSTKPVVNRHQPLSRPDLTPHQNRSKMVNARNTGVYLEKRDSELIE